MDSQNLETVNKRLDRTDITATNTRRAWIIDQLGGLIRNGKIPKEDGWVLSVLNWFVVHGLFIVKKKSSKSPLLPVSSNISTYFRLLTDI